MMVLYCPEESGWPDPNAIFLTCFLATESTE